MDQDGAGQVLLVSLDDKGGRPQVSIEPRRVGQTRSEKLELDVSTITTQPALIDTIGRHADSDLVLDVRLTGIFPDTLDVDLDEVEKALARSFLRFRIRDVSIPALPEGPTPPPDTVIGAFVRAVEARISELEKPAATKGSLPAVAAQGSLPAAAAQGTRPADSTLIGVGQPALLSGTPGQDPAEELADLREVLRLGRHLLEGRQVTL